MPDKKLEAMLAIANTLTADDLDCLRSVAPVAIVEPPDDESEAVESMSPDVAEATSSDDDTEPDDDSPSVPDTQSVRTAARQRATPTSAGQSAGEYERQRTRESKVSTTCLGKQREPHEWWPIGTHLVGHIGTEEFTAIVVENPAVKSGRSLQIRSGAATGRVCITPTRAAIEATEDYRQAHTLGRGGGITNGWDFWKPKT